MQPVPYNCYQGSALCGIPCPHEGMRSAPPHMITPRLCCFGIAPMCVSGYSICITGHFAIGILLGGCNPEWSRGTCAVSTRGQSP